MTAFDAIVMMVEARIAVAAKEGHDYVVIPLQGNTRQYASELQNMFHRGQFTVFMDTDYNGVTTSMKVSWV